MRIEIDTVKPAVAIDGVAVNFRPDAVQVIFNQVAGEYERSKMHGEQFASLHEAYAVMLEELDEVWELTRQKRRERAREDIRKELIQIAAMAVKGILSMDNFTGGVV